MLFLATWDQLVGLMNSLMKTPHLQIGRDQMLTIRVPKLQKRRIWRITVREGIILWNLDKYTRMVVILWCGNLGGVTFQRFGLPEIICIFPLLVCSLTDAGKTATSL